MIETDKSEGDEQNYDAENDILNVVNRDEDDGRGEKETEVQDELINVDENVATIDVATDVLTDILTENQTDVIIDDNAATEEHTLTEPQIEQPESSKRVEHDEEMNELDRDIDDFPPETKEELKRRMDKGKSKVYEEEHVKTYLVKRMIDEEEEASAAAIREFENVVKETTEREIIARILSPEELADQEALIDQANVTKVIDEKEADDQIIIEALTNLKRAEEVDNSLAMVVSMFKTQNQPQNETNETTEPTNVNMETNVKEEVGESIASIFAKKWAEQVKDDIGQNPTEWEWKNDPNMVRNIQERGIDLKNKNQLEELNQLKGENGMIRRRILWL